MNKLMLLCLCISAGAYGHSQSPRGYGGESALLDAVSLSPIKVIPVTVGNLNDYPQAYHIEVDGVIVGATDSMAGGTSSVISVPVSIDSPYTPEVHKVCSLSVVVEGQTFRTRICTTARLYWKKL